MTKLLDTIPIQGRKGKSIELHRGDLTSLHPDESIDLLIISAFPNDYMPTPSSLIGSLYQKGLSVASLANSKEIDFRENFSCWLSKEVIRSDPGIQFKRILCFEPLERGEPPEIVGDIFRALTPILGEYPDIKSIAMPLVATGDMDYPISVMLNPLLDAAIQWMESGIPLDNLRVFLYSDEEAKEARSVFNQIKGQYQQAAPRDRMPVEYDVLISYSHKNTAEMEIMLETLNTTRPNIQLFLDRMNIDIGTPWQPKIFESIDKSRKVVTFLSPQYIESKVCMEEFNIAWIRGRDTDQMLIFPIYLYTAELPSFIKYLNYYDCREGSKEKIIKASEKLLASLDAS